MQTSSSTTRNAANAVHDVKADLRNTLDRASETVNEAAHSVGKNIRSFISTADGEIREAAETVRTQIKSHPLQAAGVALGVGFLLGLLVRR